MAQVSNAEFKRLQGVAGRVRDVRALLRIEEVPREVLAVIAVLAAAALVLSCVLFVRSVAPGGEALTRPSTAAPATGGPAVDEQVAEPSASTVPPGEEAGLSDSPEPLPGLVVHVSGAVESPGVYELPHDARVVDAVEQAGGATPWADLAAINLAELLVDGAKVTVPTLGETASVGGSAVEAPGAAARSLGGGTPVNINTAGIDELQGLPGVGEATAAAIVRDRTANGPFATPEDLMRVSGIGEKKFEKMRPQVVV